MIDTDITGYDNVGGIVGGAVAKVENCLVGGIQESDTEEAETFEEGEYAVRITGNSGIGGIIGNAGVISSDSQVMIILKGNTIENAYIEGKIPIDKIIAIHNSFGTNYEGTQVEDISGNSDVNCTVNTIE